MTLRYKIAEGIRSDSVAKRGFCVVKVQPNGVAVRERLQEDHLPLQEDEYLIEYTYGKRSINIGAESFFFEEGQGDKFESAKYGGVRVDNKGNSILTGLYDENLQKIE